MKIFDMLDGLADVGVQDTAPAHRREMYLAAPASRQNSPAGGGGVKPLASGSSGSGSGSVLWPWASDSSDY